MKLITPILFHRPKNLLSKGIRLVTGSYWNHAGLLVWVEGEEYLVEAVGGGVRILLWSNAKNHYDKANCEYKHLVSCKMERDFVPKLGAGYEYLAFPRELACYASLKLFGECKLTDWLSNIDNQDKFVCFEFLAYVMGKQKTWKSTGKTFDNRIN